MNPASDAKTFYERSHTRIDLAGGTLDLWPISQLVPHASTLNASINCYTSVSFQPKDTESISIKVKSPDFQESFKVSSRDEILNSSEAKLSLFKEATVQLFDKASWSELYGDWELKSESPAGSGLGGSSSLLISLLKVLFQLRGLPLKETSLIEAAKNIETCVLEKPAGIQDYFSPVRGGLNCISFHAQGYDRESLDEVIDFWRERLTIVDSEIKHHSGMNNWEIFKSFVDGDKKTAMHLGELARVAVEVKKALKNKDILSLKKEFEKELQTRSSISSSYINDEVRVFISKLKKDISSLHHSLKLCGAGGGGCLLILHDQDQKEDLHKQLQAKGYALLPFQLEGAQLS